MPSKRKRSSTHHSSPPRRPPGNAEALSNSVILGIHAVAKEALASAEATMRRVAAFQLEMAPKLKALADSMETYEAKALEAYLSFLESPRGRILRKMLESRGALRRLPLETNVFFVPEAVLDYGFAHLPTSSDPEGKLVQQLPAIPDAMTTAFGAYLYFPKISGGRRSVINPEMDPAYVQAKQIYEQDKPRGVEPEIVLRALRMDAGIERLWLALKPEANLDDQVSELKRWLGRTQRALFGRKGVKRRSVPDAPRQVLIFTLWESGQLEASEIAQRVFPKEYEASDKSLRATKLRRAAGDPLEARIRQTIRYVRQVLSKIGILVPPRRKR